MIRPHLQGEAFLADVRQGVGGDSLRLWWLGQSGFLIQWAGRHLLLDPYLSDSLTRKYAGTDKPHVRMTERVVDPQCLDFIDLVTSSHSHTDHLDAETLQPLFLANPNLRMIFPEANRSLVRERAGTGIPEERLLGVDADQTVEAVGIRFTGVPAAHETIQRDELGRCLFLGFIVQCGPWTIYHSGDTVRYAGMAERLSRWRVDVMLLPINGCDPARRVAGNLSGPEAAVLAKDSGARLVIPCHYDMFEFNTASPDSFVRTATEIGQTYRVLRCGERWYSAAFPSEKKTI